MAPALWLLCRFIFSDTGGANGERLKSLIQVELDNQQRFLEMSGGKVNSGRKFKAQLALEICFVCLDTLLDAVCLFNLLVTEQYVLMALQAVVLVVSLIQQLRLGILDVLAAFIESFRVGFQTDKVIQTLQSEKLVEAFLFVLIQGVALSSSLDDFSAFQLSVSMCVSMLGITKAIYKEVHLDLASRASLHAPSLPATIVGKLLRRPSSSACKEKLDAPLQDPLPGPELLPPRLLPPPPGLRSPSPGPPQLPIQVEARNIRDTE